MPYRRLPNSTNEHFQSADGGLALELQRLVGELRASEDRWRSLVDNAPFGILVHQDGRFAFANHEALRILGAREFAELKGRKVLDFAAPESREMIIRRIGELRAGRAAPRIHERLLRLDGASIDVELSAVPTVLDGRPAAQVMLRDISEQVRQQAEQARLTQVLETTTDLVLMVGEAAQPLYMNHAARSLLGISRDTPLSKEHLYRLHPAWALDVIKEVALPTAFRKGRWKGETAILDSQGKEIPISHLMVVHHDGSGRVKYVSNIMRDIREQKDVEATLRTLNSISLGMADAPDARAALIVAMRQARQSTGWPFGAVWLPERETETLRCAYVEHDGTPELARLEEVCRDATQHRESLMLGGTDSHRLLSRDLTTLPPSRRRDAALEAGLRHGVAVPIVADGQLIAVVEAFMRQLGEADERHLSTIAYASLQLGVIVRRKQVEDALHWHDTLLRAVTSATPGGILVVDPKTTDVLYVNERFIEIWGLGAHEHAIRSGALKGMQLVEIVAPQTVDPGSFAASFVPMRDPNARLTIEDEIQLADGRVLRRFSTQIRDTEDRCLGRLYLVEDVTERLRLERQLRQAQKMEAVGQLAGGIAHDFNNLLTAIRSYSEFLIEDIPTADPRHADAMEIKRASERASSLTRQLLLFSRQQPVHPSIISLNDTVSEIERMLRRLIGENIQFLTSLDPAAGPILVDPGQLEQAIVNLVVNARDAMPAGGTLEIRTERWRLAAPREASLGLLVPGEYVTLSVRDTGVGMDACTRGRIFEPFFTTKEVGKGSGLGLATVYGIMQRFGGNIEVVSAANAGAAFTLVFPAPSVPLAASPSTTTVVPSAGRERVLLVEDEETVRRLARRALEAKGYTVVEAASGREALALIEKHRDRFDLLLTDVIMPGMSGRELAERVRANWSRIRVVYTSGYTAKELPESFDLDEGFIAKPFTPELLTRVVREQLDRP
jgi:PAS domain S-box-containing protein